MPERILFDAPLFLLAGAPLAVALAAVTAFLLRRRGLPWGRVVALAGLRGLALLLLAFLLARPVALSKEDPKQRKTVSLLLDRSRSMSLKESGETRHARAVRLAGEKLIPALDARGLKVDPFLFADDTAALPADRLAGTVPDGTRSNLGGAIARAVLTADPPPLAVVALTDGAANESRDNNTALLALKDSYVPFIGVGFGDDEGIASLALERVLAPTAAPPKQRFRISAYLQATGGGEIPELDLLLLRDGRLAQSKRIDASRAPRLWTEGFDVIEDEPGVHDYTVEVQPPSSGGLVLVSARSNVPVVISEEREFRVLFVQGALTWNFKFIGRALRGDPSVKLTGLSRTSEHSVFRQNVESAGELVDGFPDEMAEIAPYRVVVLSEMKPSGLTPAQQEVIARFCSELGGGVLLLGGESTFD
ncbi:MAG TPA: vWA domain-containing protein, partial [Thermoanaerobaculia bacterium]|nr:vWA domain-containing protein [Thermoanaerobaculia bacterium]